MPIHHIFSYAIQFRLAPPPKEAAESEPPGISAHEQWRRMRETPARVKSERQHALLKSLLQDFIDQDSTPDANCSCHLSPPCNDCVNFAGQRMLVQDAKDALARMNQE